MSTASTTGPEAGNPSNVDTAAQAAPAAAPAVAGATLGDPGTVEQRPAQVELPAWAAGLQDAGNQDLIRTKGWKDLDEGLKSYNELEKKLGGSITLPKEGASDAEWKEFYGKLGAPGDPTGYKVDEALTKVNGYDQAQTEAFSVLANELGLTSKQFSAIAKWSVERGSAGLEGMAETISKRNDTETKALEAEWKVNHASQDFKNQLAYANGFLKGNGISHEELQTIGVLGPQGEILSSKMVIAFAKAGKALYAEEASVGRYESVAKNPFDPKTFDSVAQAKLLKEARDNSMRADYVKGLIRAAGYQPSDFQMKS